MKQVMATCSNTNTGHLKHLWINGCESQRERERERERLTAAINSSERREREWWQVDLFKLGHFKDYKMPFSFQYIGQEAEAPGVLQLSN
jgi:hypothetical protein